MGLAIKAHTQCLQESRIQPNEDKLNELIARVNAMCSCLLFNDFRLAWCLAGKIDGPGAYCDVNLECCEEVAPADTETCTWEFDPKVCDDVDCSEDIAAPAVPAEPK